LEEAVLSFPMVRNFIPVSSNVWKHRQWKSEGGDHRNAPTRFKKAVTEKTAGNFGQKPTVEQEKI